jgi:hypothetical protein
MKKNNRNFLIEHGMKEQLVMKLDNTQVKCLTAFAMDNISAPNLLQMLIQLASMEIRGKPGALELATHSIANVVQLKNLNEEQIAKLVDELHLSGDELLVRRLAKKMLIASQQEKLYFKSGGVKGEYYLYHDDIEHSKNVLS